jgi:hypothetical protein
MIEEIELNMLEDNISIHDQFQFEIKWAYMFNDKKKYTMYDIETYFFIPENLGISRSTYLKKDFYSDLKTYIRFKTPTILLRQFTDAPHDLIKDLSSIFCRVAEHPTREILLEFEDRIKLFCCEFKSSLREHVALINKREQPTDIHILLDQYIEHTGKIADGYRQLRKILNVPSIHEKVFSKYLFGDEYISLTIEDYTFSLLSLLGKKSLDLDPAYSKKLLDIVAKEIEYRKTSGYPSIPQFNSDNEVLVFRKGILKKYLGSILYLNVRSEHSGGFIEQIAFGIAAGLSMVFATAVAFFSQKNYESFSLPLFIALVISYMFKDRIKEGLRIYLRKKLDKVLYDHKITLHTKDNEKVGWCKESFGFVNETTVSEAVLKLRNKDHITEIENDWLGEQIILYKKLIKLCPKDSAQFHKITTINSINDIMRFNIERFLSKMDNPAKPIFVIHENGFKQIFAKRVYHLNLIIKYTFDNKSIYRRFRIILSRRGIRSIEMVDSN